MMRRRMALLPLTFVLGLSGCLKLTDNRNGTLVALIQLNARSKGSSYTTSPIANFYRAGSVTLSDARVPSDSCQVGTYDPAATDVSEAAVTSGGATVGVTVSGVTDVMRRGWFPRALGTRKNRGAVHDEYDHMAGRESANQRDVVAGSDRRGHAGLAPV